VVGGGATTDDRVIRGRSLLLENEQGERVVWAGSDMESNGQLKVNSKTGTDLIYAGTDITGNGNLTVKSKTGTDLICARATVEGVVILSVDDYGIGVVGAYNRKGEGRTLKPGP